MKMADVIHLICALPVALGRLVVAFVLSGLLGTQGSVARIVCYT